MIFLGLGSYGQPRVARTGGVIVVRAVRRRYRGGSLLRYIVAYALFISVTLRVLRRRLRSHRLDAVQTSNLPNLVGIVGWVARRRGARWIHDVHDPEPELFASKFGRRLVGQVGAAALRLIEGRVFGGADRVILANPPTPRMLQALNHGRKALWRLFPNLPDGTLFPSRPPRRKGTRRVVFHGTLTRRYCLETVVAALARLKSEGVAFWFDVIGAGDELAHLEHMVGEMKLSECVRFSRSLVPVEEIPALIGDAAVGVIPLRCDPFVNAVFPSKLPEYVRLGIPCVVSPTLPVTEAFSSETVLYAKDEDVGEWSAALRQALDEGADVMQRAVAAQRTSAARAWQAVEGDYVGTICGRDAGVVALGRATTDERFEQTSATAQLGLTPRR